MPMSLSLSFGVLDGTYHCGRVATNMNKMAKRWTSTSQWMGIALSVVKIKSTPQSLGEGTARSMASKRFVTHDGRLVKLFNRKHAITTESNGTTDNATKWCQFQPRWALWMSAEQRRLKNTRALQLDLSLPRSGKPSPIGEKTTAGLPYLSLSTGCWGNRKYTWW